MSQWQFYVNRPSGELFGNLLYEKVEAGVFEGTEAEARTELGERIRRTWSPYITHEFEAAEHCVERTESGLTVIENDPSELDVVYCSDCGTQEAYANGLCADCLIENTPHPGQSD